MRDADKPFVMYRRGRFNFTIVPRGIAGWLQFAVWMALLVPLTGWFVVHAEATEGTPQFVTGLVLFLGAMLVWSVAMIWWMKARAEVVDLQEMLKLKREQERKSRRGR